MKAASELVNSQEVSVGVVGPAGCVYGCCWGCGCGWTKTVVSCSGLEPVGVAWRGHGRSGHGKFSRLTDPVYPGLVHNQCVICH